VPIGKISTVFKVYDAMMGSGKTTQIIENIRTAETNQNFLYITPLLDECHRVSGTTYDEDDNLKRPIITTEDETSIHYAYDEDAPLIDRRFKHPSYKGGNKAESLQYLIKNKENVVSTHQLFMNLTPSMLEDAKDYVLIIDETIQVYDVYAEYTATELEALFRLGWIKIDENDNVTLRFQRENFGDKNLATMCDLGQLLYVDQKLIVWELSIDTLRAFKEVWIATYMFEGSQMSAYLKSYGVNYELIRFGSKPSQIKHLVNISDDAFINEIGTKKTALSSSQFRTNKKALCEQLSKNLDNFFRNKAKAKKGDRLWTSFKEGSTSIAGTRYKDEWLAFNTKATNEYRDRSNLAYLLNLFPNPMVVKASAMKGFPVKEDIFALSEMVQWVWRSAIREGNPINIYVPSSRMRDLLERWLEDEFETVVTEATNKQQAEQLDLV
jgi:predicted ATP-dependent endonuclease of OLD family